LRAPGCFELALWDSSQTTSVRNTFLAFAQIYSGQQWANAGAHRVQWANDAKRADANGLGRVSYGHGGAGDSGRAGDS